MNSQCAVEYTYLEDMNILLRSFSGRVTINDIIASWDEVINDKLVRENCVGVVSDFSICELLIKKKELALFVEYFDSKLDFFINLKLAPIIHSPKIALTVIFEQMYHKVQLKAFSTIEAATEWIQSEV